MMGEGLNLMKEIENILKKHALENQCGYYDSCTKAIEQYVEDNYVPKESSLINDEDIETIEQYVRKAKIEEHRIDCDHCNIAEEMRQISKCDRLAELKKGLK